MRKDGKSQYTIKKEKLLKIKRILEAIPITLIGIPWCEKDKNLAKITEEIWEIVKNEK